MIIPSLSKTFQTLAQDLETPEPTPESTPSGTTLIPINASVPGRRRRRYAGGSSPGGTLLVTSEAARSIFGRQSCAEGLTYYACANGFTGCCQGNPCTSTAQCSVEGLVTGSVSGSSAPAVSTGTAASSGTRAVSSTGSLTTSRATTSGIASASGTSGAASSPPPSTATTIGLPIATPAPICPGAPSDYTDPLGIAYQVKCRTGNDAASYNSTIKVGIGGYAQCCSACSTSRDCIGFRFVPQSSANKSAGTCYLSPDISASDDFNLDNSVILRKIDPSAVASTPTPSSAASSGNKSSVGAIAGGVVGGVAILGLLLALLAFLLRRHRKKIDERRAAEKATPLPTSNDPTPANERYHDRIGGGGRGHGHTRAGSTSNDIYTPQGGPTLDGPLATPEPKNVSSADHFSELEGHTSTPPGLRAEGGRALIPAAVLRPPQMVDSKSLGSRPTIQAAASRSSVFLEHMELEDTSPGRPKTIYNSSQLSSKHGESPTLGHPSGSTSSFSEGIRKRQHLLYWNNYAAGQIDDGDGQMSATMMPKTPPSARSAPAAAQCSPDGNGSPSDGSYNVSPLRVWKTERGSDPNSNTGPDPDR